MPELTVTIPFASFSKFRYKLRRIMSRWQNLFTLPVFPGVGFRLQTLGFRLLPLLLLPLVAPAQDQLTATNTAAAAPEAEVAIKSFQVAPGLKVDLWAAEPMVLNPVAFHFDEKGRAYVCETFRLGAGVDDIRGIMDWLDEELACRTVDDRLAEMKRHLGERFPRYSDNSERIRRIEDRDGDGRADHATVFAEGFNTPLDGIGAGVRSEEHTSELQS